MTVLTWLDDSTPLPNPGNALSEQLLAVGGNLSTDRLSEAYSKGIFPWFNDGEPVLWWSPDPRMVLACADFRPSQSLRKKLRQIARNEHKHDARIKIRLNTAFDETILACSQPRAGQNGTWISAQMRQAYGDWHREGRVHSLETWCDDRLMGGLYGVSAGAFFFGESMFTRMPDASKIALAYLVSYLRRHQVQHIDCQQETPHLATLGARPISRANFLSLLNDATQLPAPAWGSGQLLHTGQLVPET